MQISQATAVLTSKGWLSRQDAAFQRALLEGAVLRELSPGEAAYDLAADADGFYGLADGFLDVLIGPSAATPTLAHVARPGWWFGEAALINRSPRRGHITARTGCTLLFFPEHLIASLLRHDIEAWRRIAGITVDQLDLALTLAAGYTTRDVDLRVCSALCRLFDPGDPELVIPISQAEFAEVAGLSRNAAAPVLNTLQDAGLIEIGYRKLRVIDVDLLRNWAEP